jgi:hypothetical protein
MLVDMQYSGDGVGVTLLVVHLIVYGVFMALSLRKTYLMLKKMLCSHKNKNKNKQATKAGTKATNKLGEFGPVSPLTPDSNNRLFTTATAGPGHPNMLGDVDMTGGSSIAMTSLAVMAPTTLFSEAHNNMTMISNEREGGEDNLLFVQPRVCILILSLMTPYLTVLI